MCFLSQGWAGGAHTWALSQRAPFVLELCPASRDFFEHRHKLLPHYSTISESSILLVGTRNCLKLWKNSPHHSQLMLQVGLTQLAAILSILLRSPFSAFLFIGTSQYWLPMWVTEGNLEVGDFYTQNPFLLTYLYFTNVEKCYLTGIP